MFFCPKADDQVVTLDTFQKMTRKIIDEIHDQLRDPFYEIYHYVVMGSHYFIKIFIILLKNYQMCLKLK